MPNRHNLNHLEANEDSSLDLDKRFRRKDSVYNINMKEYVFKTNGLPGFAIGAVAFAIFFAIVIVLFFLGAVALTVFVWAIAITVILAIIVGVIRLITNLNFRRPNNRTISRPRR